MRNASAYIHPYKSNHEYEWANHLGDIAEYEPKTFDVHKDSIFGRRYTPDFFIKSMDVWLEIKSKGFNNGSSSIVMQLIRANAAVRKYNIKLILLEGMPYDYDSYIIDGSASGPKHFASLGLVKSRFCPPNTVLGATELPLTTPGPRKG